MSESNEHHIPAQPVSFSILLIVSAALQLLFISPLWSHTSTPARVLGRYSTHYALGLGGTAAVMLAWGLLAIFRDRFHRGLVRLPLIVRYSGVVVFAAMAGVAPFLPFESILRDFIVANSLLGALLLIRCLPDTPVRWRRWDLVLLGVVALMLLPMFIAVLSNRRYSPDEASYADLASSYFDRGGMYISNQLMPPYKIEPGRGWSTVLYGWLLEHVSFNLMVGRAFNFGVNVLAILGIGAVSWRLYGRKAAVISLALAVVSRSYIPVVDYRPDHQMPLGAMIIVFAAFQARYSQRQAVRMAWDAACGLLAVLSLELHGAGIVYLFSLSLYYLLEFVLASYHQRRWADARPLLGFALGASVGVGIYYALNIAPVGGLKAYLDVLSGERSQRRNVATILRTPRSIVERAAAWAAIAYLLWRRSPADRRFLGLFALIVLVGTVVDTQGYPSTFTAFFSVALGSMVVSAFQSEAVQSRQGLLAAWVMILAFTGIAWDKLGVDRVKSWLDTREFPPYMYAEIGSSLRGYLNEGDVVASTQMLIWSLHDQPFKLLSGEAEAHGKKRWHISGVEVWERVHPDVVVNIPQDMVLPPGLRDYMRTHQFEVCTDFRFRGYKIQILRPDCPIQ